MPNVEGIAPSSAQLTGSIMPGIVVKPSQRVYYSGSSLEPLLDDERAAQFLGGIHRKTLQRMARKGEVPAYRVGRFWRYRASELNDWLRLKSTGRIARVVSIKEKP